MYVHFDPHITRRASEHVSILKEVRAALESNAAVRKEERNEIRPKTGRNNSGARVRTMSIVASSKNSQWLCPSKSTCIKHIGRSKQDKPRVTSTRRNLNRKRVRAEEKREREPGRVIERTGREETYPPSAWRTGS